MATETWKGSERRDRTRTTSYDFNSRDFYIGNTNKGRNYSYSNSFSGHSETRETGVVEKLLHSYGFIQCCERALRIFFHYSQINEDPEDLNVGDEMEFEVTSDQRTGKPIACRVVRLEAGSVSFEIRSEDKVNGVIDAEPKLYLKNSAKSPSNGLVDPDMGRVSYQRNGEYFYLSFSASDVNNSGTPLHKGDKVEFYVATDKRTGVIRAREVTLVEAADTEKCQGVVSSMKESFGFIERADKVSEIFFHYSEFRGNINELMLGDDVEFGIQARNGKEVAVHVDKLPEGTVKFEDVSSVRYQGTVDRPLSKSAAKRQNDPLHGKIVFTLPDNEDVEEEIVFSERDLQGDFSLRAGDVVEFNIAVDRRDSLKRATQINLVDVAEPDDGEPREMGIVASLKEGFGFIKCCDRDARMFFHYSELLDSAHQIQVGDEVEFAVSEDTSAIKRLHAIQVRVVPKGTIQMENISSQICEGYIEREPSYSSRSPRKDSNRESESGLINCCVNGVRELLPFDTNSFDLRGAAQFGDLVEFNLSESQRTGFRKAVNVAVLRRNSEMRHKGFVATLKENFGFLETSEHDKEVFFHYSEYDGDPNELILGDEMEYALKCKNGKVSAEMLVKLPQGTITPEQILPELYVGKVLRSLRRADPQQVEYAGLIERITREDQDSEEENEMEQEPDKQLAFTVEYGITSLVDKKTVLQPGDKVRFQVAVDKQTGKEMAKKVVSIRQRVRARVESLKGQFGFIAYENEEGKNLFFHMSEVEGELELQPGDEVEFVVVQNQRSRKMSACSLRKICDSQRPERLIRKTFSDGVQSPGPRIEVIRKPTGPDGTRGFTYRRIPRSLSDTSFDHSQGCPVNGSSDTPAKFANGTAEEGNVFEDIVAKICD